eukprot:4610057-Amphidinium_carterae.1
MLCLIDAVPHFNFWKSTARGTACSKRAIYSDCAYMGFQSMGDFLQVPPWTVLLPEIGCW